MFQNKEESFAILVEPARAAVFCAGKLVVRLRNHDKITCFPCSALRYLICTCILVPLLHRACMYIWHLLCNAMPTVGHKLLLLIIQM